MKRFKLLACKVFYREISMLTFRSENFIDVTYLQQGFHDTPDILRKTLQAEIDRIDAGNDMYSCRKRESRDFDAILLGYGLCSNAICGLSSKKYKLVIPRAHDCITLFLGSKEWYRQYFDAHSGGIYWYTPGWNECTIMPGKDRIEIKRRMYMKQYDDEETVEYLLEEEHKWMEKYKTCVYIEWEELRMENHVRYTKTCAEYLGMDFDLLKGDSSLMKNFIDGNWCKEKFLVLEPGCKISQTFDETIITEAGEDNIK